MRTQECSWQFANAFQADKTGTGKEKSTGNPRVHSIQSSFLPRVCPLRMLTRPAGSGRRSDAAPRRRSRLPALRMRPSPARHGLTRPLSTYGFHRTFAWNQGNGPSTLVLRGGAPRDGHPSAARQEQLRGEGREDDHEHGPACGEEEEADRTPGIELATGILLQCG